MPKTRTVLVTGASGLIGRRLCLRLLREGWRVRALSRDPQRAALDLPLPIQWHAWDGLSEPSPQALIGLDAVVHLAGEPVAGGRWSAVRKQAILASRAQGTLALVQGLRRQRQAPAVFVAASAVGVYGDRGDEALDDLQLEEEPALEHGNRFLHETCLAWEGAWRRGLPKGTRGVGLRIGLVLASEGGALAVLAPLFRTGLAGRLGDGRAWMPWIHADDVVGLVVAALGDARWRGLFHAVAPEPVRNAEFTATLAAMLDRPAALPAPAVAVRALYGEMADIVLASQRVLPGKALALGHKFLHPHLDQALAAEFVFEGQRAVHKLSAAQWLPQKVAKVWPFFTEARNLEALTPPYLSFKVLTPPERGIRPGRLLDYELSMRGLPLRWRTLITDYQPQGTKPWFRDVQVKGPYALWHHTHRFEPLAGGTLMSDEVRYRLPLGWPADALAGWLVEKDVNAIFRYRVKAAVKVFVPLGGI